MKIKDLIIGEMCEITLVVKSAIAKETKAKKPYLSIEFYDGVDIIIAQYWDWTSGNIPAVNAVLDVRAQVTEWQGAKQLNVKSMMTSKTMQLADFAPKADFDLAEIYKAAYALMSDVNDETLRTIALALLEELREYWLVTPGAVSVHHNFIGGTLVHSYDVARKAKALAECTAGANVDLAVVGAMFHDIGKLFTYRMNGINIDMTANGRLYEHSFMGAEFLGNFADTHVDTDNPYVYGKVRLLRHIILAHHGQLEYGAVVTPQCIEAYIVHYADAIDATNEQLRVATRASSANTNWTEKLWPLNNRPHLTHTYVTSLMNSPEETLGE